MRLPENLKEILKSLNKAKEAGEEEVKNLVEAEEKREVVQLNDEEEEEEDLHSLPAGVWPKQVNECLCQFTLRLRVALKLSITFQWITPKNKSQTNCNGEQ